MSRLFALPFLLVCVLMNFVSVPSAVSQTASSSQDDHQSLSASGDTETEAVDKIVLWYRNYDAPHTLGLLKLALDETAAEYGPYEIIRSPEINQNRALASLVQRKHQLDIINVVINEEREAALQPVRVVSDRSLIGYRVCLIRKDQLQKFEGIRSHADLKQNHITIGQGTHWPDADILRQNDLSVVTAVDFERLFLMLEANRFQCFLRGVNEVVRDLDAYEGDELMIEPGLLFVYPSTSTFFTSRRNPQLAARVELGLRRALLNGHFNEFFIANHQQHLQQLNLPQRRAIYLNNPLISDEFLHKAIQWRNELGIVEPTDE